MPSIKTSFPHDRPWEKLDAFLQSLVSSTTDLGTEAPFDGSHPPTIVADLTEPFLGMVGAAHSFPSPTRPGSTGR